METKVICIGSASKDIFFPTREGVELATPEDLLAKEKVAFELGAKYQIDDRFESLGGCAANVASGLAKLRIPVSCYTKIGDDQIGQWILENLKNNGVETNLVAIEKNCKSDLSFIIVDEKKEDRLIFFNRDANELLEIDPEKIAEADFLFVSALNGRPRENWKKTLKEILTVVKKGKVQLILNPGQSNIKDDAVQVSEAVALAKIVMLNKDEAIGLISGAQPEIAGEKLASEVFLINQLRSWGPELIVLTDGVRGAWANDGATILHAEVLKETALDVTGSGDAFSSGFLGAYLKGKSVAEALGWGIVNSGHSVLFYGAIEGLLTEEELLVKAPQVKIKQS